MSVASLIKFVQGITTPPAGEALDGVTATLVTATNNDNTDVKIWKWTIVDVPSASAVPTGQVSFGSSSSMTFTPDVVGGYLIELVVYDQLGRSATHRLAVMVKEDSYNRYIAPFSAEESALNIGGQARGWATFMEPFLKVLGRLRDVGGAAPANNDVLTWVAANNRYEPKAGGGSGITQLTGDVTAGPGSGSQTATIAAGAIVNSKVNAAAAIAGTKIAPDFGSQNVITTGALHAGNVMFPSTATNPKVYHDDKTTNGATGDTLTVQAQNATGTTSTGGTLKLQSGTGTTIAGEISFFLGATKRAFIEPTYGLAAFGGGGGDYVAKVGPMPGFSGGNSGIWFLASAATAASSSNVALYSNGSQTIINVPSTGSFIGFLDAGAAYFGQWTKTELKIMTGGLVTFDTAITGLVMSQADKTTNGGTGTTFQIHAQNETGTTSTGGTLDLRGGTGTSLNGGAQIRVGSTILAEVAEVVAGNKIVALARKAAITSTQMPANTGDGVVYVGDAATDPSADPVSGGILYSSGGALYWRGSGGTPTQIAPA